MNYVGKLLSNFKGFYNEINSATLTGAIDVLIIQQADGSYVSSPFHVRFGKTGVLRSREKVVDIEINGEPVDLHMKLGEAGEAFFVQELDTEDQIPAYLATSPLDLNAEQLMVEGIKKLKSSDHNLPNNNNTSHLTNENSFQTIPEFGNGHHDDDDDTHHHQLSSSATTVKQSSSQTEGLYNWDSKRGDTPPKDSGIQVQPSVSDVQTLVGDSSTKAELLRDESVQSLYYSSADLDSPMVEKLQNCSLNGGENSGNTTINKNNKVDIAIQTDMCGSEIESRAVLAERTRSYSEISSGSGGTSKDQVNATTATQQKAVESSEGSTKSATPTTGVTMTTTGSGSGLALHPCNNSNQTTTRANNTNKRIGQHRNSEVSIRSNMSGASQASADTIASKPHAPQIKKLQKRRRRQSRTSECKESGSSNDSIPEGMFELELGEDEVDNVAAVAGLVEMTTMGRSVSLPMMDVGGISEFVDKQKLTAEWATSQFASNLHPWSDADITPIMSPVTSRPVTPKSDTEFENQKFDTSCQTLITGLGDDINKYEDIRWEWGELPKPVSVKQSEDEDKPALDRESESTSKPPGGLFQFMRKTKKIRHQPEKEGIYLDDLNLEAMDPEVAALYVYGNKSECGSSHLKHLSVAVDEDDESGRGASLPQSPVSMDSQMTSRLIKPVAHKADCMLPEVSMSLCGGLKGTSDFETGFQEKFQQNLVTFEDFSTDPNLLNHQNLVLKLNDKYYNHRMAWPILISYLAFNRPLPEPTIESLVKTHMPKRETSKRRGWFSWGRSPDYDASSEKISEEGTSNQQQATPNSSPASSVPNSPSKGPPAKDTEELDTQEQNRPLVNKVLIKSQSLSDMDDLMEDSHKKYTKSLTLTSEQIEKLHLKEGQNLAAYSVTTQYQGTARAECNVFLWKWDSKIIVSDIDGTITRSDVLGHVLPLVGKDWSQVGITNLYREIERNGYRFLYLSTRPIGQARMTRDYLRSVTQENNLKLPLGPIMLSPNSLVRALHKEVIEKKPEEFKIGCLKNIKALFTSHNPFCAGFGNKVNDAFAYRTVGIPLSRIFIVNPQGELRMELINNFRSSYTKLREIVDMFFPPILDKERQTLDKVHPKNFPAADQFSTFTYWREPLPDVTVEMDVLVTNPASESKK